MKLTDYHSLRTGMQRNASPGSPEEVADLEQRLHAALAETGLFHSIEVDHTDDPDRLVIALVQFSPGLDEGRVAWQLERLWHDVLAYPFWSADSMLVETGHAELQGATRSSQLGGFLTLHLVAQAAVPTKTPAATVVPQAPREAPVVPSMPTQTEPEDRPVESARRRRLLGRF